jgi:hypothetical protein
MTADQLRNFVKENDIEYRYVYNRESEQEDLLMFPSVYSIREFNSLLSPCIFDDDGIECYMQDGYFAIWMKHICEYEGIELDEVFGQQQLTEAQASQ